MAFIPENELDLVLIKAAKDVSARPHFYEQLQKSDVFIITDKQYPDSTFMVKEGDSISFHTFSHENKNYVAVFTSLRCLTNYSKAETPYIKLKFIDLIEMIKDSEIIINPGNDYGKILVTDEIKGILDGSIWTPSERFVAKKDIQVMIGHPAKQPTELLKALRKLYSGIKEVKKAYNAHFFNPEIDKVAHTLIGIETDGDWDKIMSSSGIVARDVIIPDPPVDFIRITDTNSICSFFLNECKPFYKKGLF